jgi:hypothetical protein
LKFTSSVCIAISDKLTVSTLGEETLLQGDTPLVVTDGKLPVQRIILIIGIAL